MRWIPRVTAVTLFALAIVVASVSLARAACPPQDLACLADETVGQGRNGVDETIGPVDSPGDETLAPVTDGAGPVLVDLNDRVKDLLDGAGVEPPPDPIGGGGGGGHGPGRTQPGTRGDGPGGDATSPGETGGRAAGAIVPSSGTSSDPVTPRTTGRSTGTGFEGALEGVARSLAIVLLLFGLAVGFVSIQDRLDRSDPRLALAPVESDIVEFA